MEGSEVASAADIRLEAGGGRVPDINKYPGYPLAQSYIYIYIYIYNDLGLRSTKTMAMEAMGGGGKDAMTTQRVEGGGNGYMEGKR